MHELLYFVCQCTRITSYIPESNDVNCVAINAIYYFVEVIHHIASMQHSAFLKQWIDNAYVGVIFN